MNFDIKIEQQKKTKFKTLKQDIDRSEHKLKGLNADINHKQQAFNDLEHIAFNDLEAIIKKKEEEEYYQSLKNVLYEPLSNEFEYEYKKVYFRKKVSQQDESS